MNLQKSTQFLTLVLAGAAILVAAIWVWGLYMSSLQEERTWLLRLVSSQARLVEAVSNLEAGDSLDEQFETSWPSTLASIEFAYDKYAKFGETGEFVWGHREGDKIVFLFNRRFAEEGGPAAISLTGSNAEPMRRALQGGTGTVIGRDYRGVEVLAAYDQVAGVNAGIVAKMDMSEIRRPFIVVAILGGFSTLIVIIIGALMTKRINAPMIEMLNRSKEAADRSNKAKSIFLANMSHDLRTPLTAILGFAQMIEGEALGPLGNDRYREYAKDIHDSGKLLVRMIDDILDLSKVEAGKYKLSETVVEPGSVIRTAVNMTEMMAKDLNLTLTVNLQPGLPKLRADETSVVQILNNLLSNAVKFSRAGDAIKVSAERLDAGGMVIRVTDTGIGMSHRDVALVLNPYEQADIEHSRRHKGTGLGLHICRKLMLLHGGSLDVDSKVGHGTTVSITFPRDRMITTV